MDECSGNGCIGKDPACELGVDPFDHKWHVTRKVFQSSGGSRSLGGQAAKKALIPPVLNSKYSQICSTLHGDPIMGSH
eukprot:272975-Pelagomonas_calceolata.AAC.2